VEYKEGESMKDQYGDAVPEDLVLLPHYDFDVYILVDARCVEKICNAAWYEVDQILMASAKAIDYISEDDPLDTGVDLSKVTEISRVAEVLKRGNPKDGFYHV